MYKAEDISRFVHQSFDIYGLDFERFFNEWVDEEGTDGDGHPEELPLALGDKIDMDLLIEAANTLGVTADAFLNLDEEAVRCWYRKYPYFKLKRRFDASRRHSFKFFSSQEEMILDSLFNENYKPENHRRYKSGIKEDIKERLIATLKLYNTVMPGCYHEDCEIMKLDIETSNFFSFPEIAELTESYLSMLNRARNLFYKLWDSELPNDEIREYNFLVSVLGMRDVGYGPLEPIYYETARKFAPIYKQEGYNDYLSYIRYLNADIPALYTCKEFYDYPKLIEKIVQELPEIKAKMGRMAVLAKSFLCTFTWSDEVMPTVDTDADEYPDEMLCFDENDMPPQYYQVNVAKTGDELHGDEKYITICERLSAPASQGGLVLTVPEYKRKSEDDFKRIAARVMGGH